MVQENPEEIYTYALEQDRWVLDRLTAGRYFFPELYEDRGHGVFTEVSISDLPAFLSEARAKASDWARHLHVKGSPPNDNTTPVSFSSVELGIQERGDT